MRPIGFSTGALALGDYKRALHMMRGKELQAVELSALRQHEMEPLVRDMADYNLSSYEYVSLHAPSSYNETEEEQIVALIQDSVPKHWTVILHPDCIKKYESWRTLGMRVAIENMDRRKGTGRNVVELLSVFKRLPEARFCFDIGHAQQYDPSMTHAYDMLRAFSDRLCEVHISQVSTNSQHEPLSFSALIAFQRLSPWIPAGIPVVIESRVGPESMCDEIVHVRQALDSTPPRYMKFGVHTPAAQA